MLIRFCATIDNADAAAGGGFAVLLAFLRSGFWDVVFAAIAFPGVAGQAALQPDPDAFPVGVYPRSAITITWSRPQKLKRTGKPKLTALDGL
jgi:hypothetical protein